MDVPIEQINALIGGLVIENLALKHQLELLRQEQQKPTERALKSVPETARRA